MILWYRIRHQLVLTWLLSGIRTAAYGQSRLHYMSNFPTFFGIIDVLVHQERLKFVLSLEIKIYYFKILCLLYLC